MDSVICTLFEGDYHFGLAAFINSVYQQGFRGDIYAGYRGSLPVWAINAKNNSSLLWQGAQTFHAAEGIAIHFLPVITGYHLTNYKPDFILSLWDGPAKDAEAIFYFDPDIVVTYNWKFYEEWAGYGVALCEDVNSPMLPQHPRRMAWRKYFGGHEIKLNFDKYGYANGGFVGVCHADKNFISLWIDIQNKIAPLIGGLGRSAFPGEGFLSPEHSGVYSPFSKTDQDALNIAVGAWGGKVSMVGKEGMGFQPGGGHLMLHALGSPKPWKNNYLVRMAAGYPPKAVDKKFWQCVGEPIKPYSGAYISWKNFTIKIASFIGRCYSRLAV